MEKITSRSNPLLVHMKKLASSASYRKEQGLFLGDSPKLLAEAVKWNMDIQEIVKTETVEIGSVCCKRIVEVPADVMESVSPMKTPQGVLFSCRLPEMVCTDLLDGNCYIVLDRVQDPGNVGTILRTLDAFAGSGLILLPGCADPYSLKVLRASMGAVFRSPVYSMTVQQLADTVKKSGLRMLGTTLRENTKDITDVTLKKVAVAIGSEGQGLSEEIISLCDDTIKIPMTEKCESLNAAMAAGIVLWESFR